jgi:protein O-GlcNAc transferase
MNRMQQIVFDTALAHQRAGKFQEALRFYKQSLEFDANEPQTLHMLGVLHHQMGQSDKAIEFIQKSLAIHRNPDTYNNLGNILKHIGRLTEAVETYQLALALKPDYAPALTNLGSALERLGQHDAALQSFNRAVAADRNNPVLHSNALSLLNYLPTIDPATVFEQHQQWGRLFADQTPRAPAQKSSKDPNRVLRIGYVSGDFRRHSVAFFIEPILRHHDRSRFAIYCYSDVVRPDAVTQRLASYPLTFRSIVGMNDEKAARLIYQDGINILVDLAGHTGSNRLMTFAWKPAPVQVTYLGYPNTTGVRAIDYRLTDAIADPPGPADQLHAEKLLRLPGCAWLFAPPEDAPAVGPLPAQAAGHITFASFNNFTKVNGPLLELWARILAGVPNSKLLLKSADLQIPATQQRIRDIFARHTIAPDRIAFSNAGLPYADHLALYNRVDIALDTFPYNGTTTTLEALYMGVPVVTQTGSVHAARVGTSLLTALALPQLIASSPDDYVQRAIALASDLPALAALRSSLRERLRQSPLVTPAPFIGHLETAYRTIWRTACTPNA